MMQFCPAGLTLRGSAKVVALVVYSVGEICRANWVKGEVRRRRLTGLVIRETGAES